MLTGWKFSNEQCLILHCFTLYYKRVNTGFGVTDWFFTAIMYVPDFLYKSCVAGQPVEFVLDEVFVMSRGCNNQGRGKYHLPIKH